MFQEKRKRVKRPAMLLRIYSLVVLALDLLTLCVGIWFAIIVALFRTLRPPPLKSLQGEVALVRITIVETSNSLLKYSYFLCILR